MVLYLFLLIYFLFFAEWYGRGPDVNTEPRYNLIPFQEIKRYWNYWEIIGPKTVCLNLLGNVIGFVPLGFLLPVVFPDMKRTWTVIKLGLMISILVECMQLFLRVGSCDVDDVLLNTIGTAVGYMGYRICNVIRRTFYGKKTKV